ncbi:MAG: hypothetical protein J6U82_06685 [Alistipes sp.]|nr:hypothetical protein [Alistipes sp.]
MKKSNKKGKGLKWGLLVLLGLILVSPKNETDTYDDDFDSDTSIEIQQENTETNSDFKTEEVDTSKNKDPISPPAQEDQKQEPAVETPAEENEPTPDTQYPVVEIDPETAFRDSLKQYFLVGSNESDKYHSPSCRWTNKINDGNLVHFDSYEEANAAGYQPCGTCQ